MAIVELRGGAHVDLLNAGELGAELDLRLGPEQRAQWWGEQAQIAEARRREDLRTLKRMEITQPVQPAASTYFLAGPEEGYVWSVKLVSVSLGAAGNFAVYKASAKSDIRRLVGQAASLSVNSVNQAVVTWGSDQHRLKHGEGVYLTADQAILGIYLAAWSIISEKEAELLLWPSR